MEQKRTDRRRVNQPVGEDRRVMGKPDRRRCPQCGSSVRQAVEHAPGGTLTRRFCTKCGWKALSRQVDEAKLKSLAGFEMTVHGSAKKALLELEPDFLKAAKLKPGDTVELKAIYTPGGKSVLSWVLRKMD